MPTWKLTLEYDGSRYSGWQEQHNARTVMGELRVALERFLGERVELMGSGRTDAGVHATGQVAHLRSSRQNVDPANLLARVNDALPHDIAVLDIASAPASFHARHDAASRTYLYRISRRKTAFEKKFVWWIKDPLDLAAMEHAAKLLEGRHDFARFRQADPRKEDESSVVDIEAVTIEEQPARGLILVRITASHYVWRMVRRLVGALVQVGKGALTPAALEALLQPEAPEVPVAEWTAPAAGLFLESVRYRTAARPKRRP
ncbi:MAG: tRNA pseudouridine(38-40) synthase TruA [Bryobacteraceae bacterium]